MVVSCFLLLQAVWIKNPYASTWAFDCLSDSQIPSLHRFPSLVRGCGNEGIQQTTSQMVFYVSIRGVKLYLTKLNGQLHAELDWLFPLIYLIYYQSHGLNIWCSFFKHIQLSLFLPSFLFLHKNPTKEKIYVK